MVYISAREAADKWGISQRRVVRLCSEGRVEDAARVGKVWIIPTDAKKPDDARTVRYEEKLTNGARPFLKWAGGKGQLVGEIAKYYPFENSHIKKYAEPFVGGGAVLFDILNKYSLAEVYVSDVNAELINAYKVIRDDLDSLVDMLYDMQSKYLEANEYYRKEQYLTQRARYNELKLKADANSNLELAALLIFLNKTCFNGLYRVNRKGLFNVPMGAYKNPLICDEDNLRAVSEKLQGVSIVCGDYRMSEDFIDDKTFVYIDPPYRPLTETASFTSYTKDEFGDREQLELASFVERISERGAKVLVSNSDPKNVNPDDNFFENAYARCNINRVRAKRMINSKSDARGEVAELLISNC